jgi:hypothetical protein
VVNADVNASAAIAFSKLAALTSAHILVGNGSAVAADVALSGDCTLANTGAITCTKTSGSNFATSATTDTTNASNIGTGLLATARVAATRTINAQTGTTYTFVLADGASQGGHPIVTGSNASAETFTVPTNASVAFAVGDQIDVCQFGAGKLTIAAAGGVTINSQGSNLSLAGQYACATLLKTATNVWLFVGNIGA